MFNMIKHFNSLFFLILISFFTSLAVADEGDPLPAKVQQISVNDAKKLYDSGAKFVDTRTSIEMYFGVIKNAVAINKRAVSKKASSLIPNKEEIIVTYCAWGVRANVAAENFIKLGYKNVYVIHDAGFSDWKKAGYPTTN